MKVLTGLLLAAALWGGQPRYARLGEFRGDVEVQFTAADSWLAAESNLPLIEGAWLSTAAASRVEVELDDGGLWRLGAESLGEISDYTRLSTGQRITLLSLDHGVAYFTGVAQGDDSLVLTMAGAQITIHEAASVRIEAGSEWDRISVLAGTVVVSSPAIELSLSAHNTMLVDPARPASFRLVHNVPVYDLDTWSAARDHALAAPTAAIHLAERYALADLDAAGDWTHTGDYGAVWKPRVDAAWAPFRNGRWRWYAPLGFTWVGGETWGWLPYHYGRWVHHGELGWLWVPGTSQVFKPGDVYWLRGAKFVAWGPLAPAEPYPPQPAGLPQQFFDAYTTYATCSADATVIDPAGFTARPKEPLKLAVFVTAPPSPPLDAARLEVKRPVLSAGSTRVQPVLAGVTYRANAPEPPAQPYVPPPPPPTAPAPPPLPADDTAQESDDTGVLQVPVPLLAYIQRDRHRLRPPSTAGPASSSLMSPAKPGVAPGAPGIPAAPAAPTRNRPEPTAPPSPRRWQRGEVELYQKALDDGENPQRQVEDLDRWKQQLPSSDHEADRTLLYVQAYNRMRPAQFDNLVRAAAPLLRTDPHRWFDDTETGRARTLALLYLVAISAPRLSTNNTEGLRICTDAAYYLLSYLPEFFDRRPLPAAATEQAWKDLRAEMDSAARATLVYANSPQRRSAN